MDVVTVLSWNIFLKKVLKKKDYNFPEQNLHKVRNMQNLQEISLVQHSQLWDQRSLPTTTSFFRRLLLSTSHFTMPSADKEGYYPWSAVCADAAIEKDAISYLTTNGYVVLTSFATADETASLRRRATAITSDFLRAPEGASVFTTVEQVRKMDDSYFLASGSKVSCFLEDEGAEGGRAVNKIGHALHDLDDVFEGFSRQGKVRRVAEMMDYGRAMLVQSMYIVKGARVGGEVRAHRDKTFILGKEGGCLGMWWALQDADVGNGCLWAVKGSHLDGRGVRRFVRDGIGGTRFEGEEQGEEYKDEDFVSLEVREGDLVVLDGGLVHKSERNESERSRHAYSIHMAKGGLEEACWLRRGEDFPFRAL